MKLVSGWKSIRISQEVYKDVEYRRGKIVEDASVPLGVLIEYAYLKFLFMKHPEAVGISIYTGKQSISWY